MFIITRQQWKPHENQQEQQREQQLMHMATHKAAIMQSNIG